MSPVRPPSPYLNRPRVALVAWVMLVVLLLAGYARHSAEAQTVLPERDDIQAGFQTDTTSFNIGDNVTLDIVLVHQQGVRVLQPEFAREWGDFEVIGWSQPDVGWLESGFQQTSLILEITGWSAGTFATQPLQLTVAAADGQLYNVDIPSIELTVASILDPADPNPRDIKPQAQLPLLTDWVLIIQVVIASIAVLIALVIIFIRFRREPVEISPADEVDLREPHIIALEELDTIEAAQLPHIGEFQQHYMLISETVRRYMERAYEIAAMEETTFEIRSELRKKAGLSKQIQKQAVDLLQTADLVKFAKARPNLDAAERLPSEARRFIQDSHKHLEAERAVQAQLEREAARQRKPNGAPTVSADQTTKTPTTTQEDETA